MKLSFSKKCFSLTEIIVVICIMALLIAISTFYFSDWLKSSRDGRRYTDLNNISVSLSSYYFQNKTYPQPNKAVYIYDYSGVLGNIAYQGIFDDSFSTILQKIPKDPSNDNYYVYTRIELSPGGYEIAGITENIPKTSYQSKTYAATTNGFPYMITHYNPGTFSGITLPCASIFWIGTGYLSQTNIGATSRIDILTDTKQVMQITGSSTTISTGNMTNTCGYMQTLGITTNTLKGCIFGGDITQGDTFDNCNAN